MCGIIAYLGNKICIDYLLNGLHAMQNRGYDSAGIAVIQDNKLTINKFASTNNNNALLLLNEYYKSATCTSTIGIGHTRWATHGEKNDTNAHPHTDNKNRIAIVHNGIIENYRYLKDTLISNGYTLYTQTDSEIIAVLIGKFIDEDYSIEEAIKCTITLLKGTWALCIMNVACPEKIWITRNGSPLLLGIDDEFIMVASEPVAFGKHIQKYIVLENNDIIEISTKNNKINYTTNIQRYKMNINTAVQDCELPNEYNHWMIKEIFEQPDCIIRAINNGGRISGNTNVKLGGLDSLKPQLENIDHLIILGCGTSYYSGLWATHMFKEYDIFETITCFDGAEFTINDIPKKNKTALILLSQSGETKDLHRCILMAKTYDLLTIGVVNVYDSMIARESDCGVYLNAGRENAVASTKSFTNQCVILTMICIWFSQNKGTHIKKRQLAITDLRNLSFHIQDVFENIDTKLNNILPIFDDNNSLFILGKGKNEAIAKEASLKIKEVCYKHAEGYSTSALKHGPFALITDNLPIILIDTENEHREKIINAYNEIKSRKGNILIITDSETEYETINIPKENILKIEKNNTFSGVIANVYTQLISYYLSIRLNYNPDYPRNLAKVVTVE
jgi:glucosamine--fructose-6-phosphate aminotransferase (isomerizing)